MYSLVSRAWWGRQDALQCAVRASGRAGEWLGQWLPRKILVHISPIARAQPRMRKKNTSPRVSGAPVACRVEDVRASCRCIRPLCAHVSIPKLNLGGHRRTAVRIRLPSFLAYTLEGAVRWYSLSYNSALYRVGATRVVSARGALVTAGRALTLGVAAMSLVVLATEAYAPQVGPMGALAMEQFVVQLS